MPLLLPTHNFGKKESSPAEMALVLAGWATAGVIINAFALGIQRRPITSRPLSHVAWAIGFAGLGYIGHRIERYETARLEVERDRLVKRRMLRSE